MTQNDFMKFFDMDFSKNFSGFGAFPFDVNNLMEGQRKNMEALTEAGKQTMETMQEAMQKQGALMSQIAEDNSAIAKEIMSNGTPGQKVAKQTEMMKKNYEKSVTNIQEINDMISKSNQQANEIISKRVTASLTEVKSAMGTTKAKTKKAA